MKPTPPSPWPVSPVPPEAWQPLWRLARLAGRPVELFLRIEAASGILLLVATALALGWANSPWAASYHHLCHTSIGMTLGPWHFERSLSWWVNDVLMVLFFFVVGLEIRRELHQGELSEWRRAALPAAAAVGGIAVPALLYLTLADQPELRSGWAVPMATDIAFALGIMTLLGKRVPPALRILLLSLAVIDDLAAIGVIALFYSTNLALSGFLAAALGIASLLLLQRLGVRAKLVYGAPALVLWAGIYAAGIHPTIAGVIMGLCTPVRAWLGPAGFLHAVRDQLSKLSHRQPQELSAEELAPTLHYVDRARREALSPAASLIEAMHPWVAFGIMPLFAFANAGVTLDASALDAMAWRLMPAVAIALAVGKPAGILLAAWLAVKLRLGALAPGLGLRHLLVLGTVAGIGFTMALFVAQLAFADERLLAAAKLAVLAASLTAAVAGLILGRLLLPNAAPAPGPHT